MKQLFVVQRRFNIMKYHCILAVLLLAGCAHQQVNPLQAEMFAWDRSDLIISEECFGGMSSDEVYKSTTRKNLKQKNACARKVRDEIVFPVAVFPDLYAQEKARGMQINNEYISGKIDKDEWAVRKQESFSSYVYAAQSRLQEAARYKQGLDIARGNALMTFGGQMQNHALAQQAIYEANRPRMATCNPNGIGGVNCTQW